MNYSLKFKQEALREWHKLDSQLKTRFKKKLEERLQHPYVQADRLAGQSHRFKIKLRNVGYRLVYEVRETELVVVVIAVGKREKNKVYKASADR